MVTGATATLAARPGTPANPFTGVFTNSVDVSWLANGNPPYTEYRVMASTASDFSGTLYGPYAGPLSWNIMTSTSVISLAGCTLYYFRVQARNMNGIETDFEVLGSTYTAGYSASGLNFLTELKM
ncbi:MAG: fibronectin type III domain-containing protein [Elusimicrobiota bacterium]|nr:fibronectin type III domain-containing protein [Elusimicrobiota bacterium]